MDRKQESVNQLVEKVRQYFPKQVRQCLEYKQDYGANGSEPIVIYGRFPNRLPQFDPKLLEIINGKVVEKQQDSTLIEGKWEGMNCRIQLRCEALAAAAQ